VMVMRKHQRYFPLYKPATQDLLPFFITVANGPVDVPTVKVSLPSALPFNPPVDVPTTQGQLALLFCLSPSLCLLSGSVFAFNSELPVHGFLLCSLDNSAVHVATVSTVQVSLPFSSCP